MSINVGTAIGYLDLDTSGFKRGFTSALQDLRAFNDSSATAADKVGALGSAFTSAGAAMTKNLTVPIAGAGAAVVATATKFETAMSEVAAISGATGSDLQALTDKAQEMGATTKFSASESAAALKYMAMAGWDTEAMLNGINGVMQLAAASGEDLASTSDIVTDAMTAFGLSADQSTRFADVLAMTANRSNTSVALMGETFKYVAPVAGALGYSIEDASVAIGLMANSGIKGSQAGTSLKNVLTNLAKPTDQVQSYMDKLNISMTDMDGQVKPLNQLLNEMRDSFAGLTEAEKAEYAAGIAGKEGMSGLLAIVNASQGDFDKLTEAINNSSGAAQSVADVMMNNLSGQLTILKSTLEGIAISFGNILLPAIKKVAEALQNFLNWINGLDEGQKQLIVTIAAVVAAIGPVLLIVGKLITSVSSVMHAVTAVKTGIAGLQLSLAAAGTSLGAVLAPIAAVVAAIVALVAAFKHLWDTNEAFRTRITEIWNQIKETFSVFADGMLERINALGFDFTNLTEVLGAVWDGFCNLLAPLFEGAFQHIAIVLQTVLGVLTNLFDVFKGLFTGDWELFWQGISGIFSTIWEGIQSSLSNVLETIKCVVNTFLGWFGTSWDELLNTVKQWGTNIINWARTTIPNICETILNFFRELPGKMLEIGKNLLMSLADGIASAVSAVIQKVKQTCNNILSSIKGVFGIASPSKETSYMGNMLMEGLAKGISDSLGLVKRQVENVSSVVSDTFEQALPSARMFNIGANLLESSYGGQGSSRLASASAAPISSPVSNTYIFNSPKAVVPTVAAKLMKQTAQQLSMEIK